MADGRAKVSQLDFAVVVKVMGPVGGEGTHTDTHKDTRSNTRTEGQWQMTQV